MEAGKSMTHLKPDYYVSDYAVVNRDWLHHHGISYIFSDLDNTLVPHGETGDQKLQTWMEELNEAGITLVGTSNNNDERAQLFRDEHGIIVLEDCKKPRTKILKQYLQKHGISIENVIFMGDQLFVDVLCGNRLGADTVLVDPIDKNTPLLVKSAWMFDRLLMKLFRYK